MAHNPNNNIKDNHVYGYLIVSTDNHDTDKDAIRKKKEELGLLETIEWIEETINESIDWKKRDLGKFIELFKP